MTSGILNPELSTSRPINPQFEVPARPAMDPQFEHAISPWLLVTAAFLLGLLLTVFFVYGQMAPGA